MRSSALGPASEWCRHGTVLLPCIAGIALVAVHGYSLGVMIAPLQEEFGWTRAQISMGHLIISSMSLFLAPLVGIVIDRLGPRPVAIFGVIAYCAALAGLATTGATVISWWSRWVILGLASAIILPTVWITAINSLFVENRGKALAFALLGTGLGAAVVPPLATYLMGMWGWRGAYVGMAALMGVVVTGLVLIFFYGATDRSRSQAGAVPAAGSLPGYSKSEGFRSAAFIKLAVSVFVFGVTTIAMTVNAVPILMAEGLSVGTAAGIASLTGIGSLLGRLAGGFLLDYFEARKVAAISVVAPVISVSLLLFLPASPLLASIAFFTMGLSLGAEVDACSYLAARHFGMRSFSSLFGTINGLVVFGSGLAPVVANFIYDVTDSYDPILWATIPLCLFASILFLRLGQYPDFDPAN